jgi:hypothetical protein
MQVTAKINSSNGAKIVTRTNKFLLGSIMLVCVSLWSLNYPQLFFEPLPLWCRVTDQALLILGIIGSAVKNKPMRFLGWTGIVIFALYVLIGSIPSLDHPAFDASGEQQPRLWIPKLAMWLAITALLAFFFRKSAIIMDVPAKE